MIDKISQYEKNKALINSKIDDFLLGGVSKNDKIIIMTLRTAFTNLFNTIDRLIAFEKGGSSSVNIGLLSKDFGSAFAYYHCLRAMERFIEITGYASFIKELINANELHRDFIDEIYSFKIGMV